MRRVLLVYSIILVHESSTIVEYGSQMVHRQISLLEEELTKNIKFCLCFRERKLSLYLVTGKSEKYRSVPRIVCLPPQPPFLDL